MPRLPDTTFGRLGLLIAGVALALLLLVLLAIRAFGLGPSGAIYADLVVGNVHLAQATPNRLPANVRRSARAPGRSHEAWLPAQRLILARVHQDFGHGARVLFSEGRESWVWVSAEPGAGWTGVRVPAFLSQSVGLGLALLLAAALAVMLAAWGFARHLTRPLVRLAERARGSALSGPGRPAAEPGAPREVRELQTALDDAATRVQASVRERELLLAGVSHDLRTPLARLRLALELQPGIAESEREPMVADVAEMDAIVGQFLDYVRDGRDEPAQACDLALLLQDLARDASRQGHDWQVEASEPVQACVRPLALRRALANLMSNAQRYGRSPFALSARGAPGGCLLSVDDAGPGLPEGLRERVGEAFLRSDAGAGGGTGLGLALVQRVAHAHGGRLDLLDRPGGGCSARLFLPAG